MKNSDSSKRMIFNRFVKSFAALSISALAFGSGRVLSAEDKSSESTKLSEGNVEDSAQGSPDTKILEKLSHPDGLQYIGGGDAIEKLAKIEPEFHGQRIFFSDISRTELAGHLELSHDDVLYYDAKDTKTPHDGVLCFVTDNGHRWKRLDRGVIRLEWCDRGEEDKSVVLQRAVDTIIRQARASGKTYELPIIKVRAGRYNMRSSVLLPPYIQIQSQGSVTFDFSATQGQIDGFIINSESPLKSDALKMPGNNSPCLNGINGAISILGAGRKISQSSALVIGNDKSSDTPCRDVKFANLVITGWNKANQYKTTDTYLINIRDCRLENNAYNVYVAGKNKNSGEKISYDNCILAGAGNENIYVSADGFDFNFLNCSFDFSRNDILGFYEGAGYQCVRFIGCHFEQWDGYVVNCKNRLNNISVIMSNVIFLPRSNLKNIVNGPSRALFKLNAGVSMHLSGFEIRHEFPAVNNNIYMCEGDKGTFDAIGYVKDPYPQLPRKDTNVTYHDFTYEDDFIKNYELSDVKDQLKHKLSTQSINGVKHGFMSPTAANIAPLTLKSKFIKVEPGSSVAIWCSLVLDISDNTLPKVVIKLTSYDSEKNVIDTQHGKMSDFAIYRNKKLRDNSFHSNQGVIPSDLNRFKLDRNSYFVTYDISINNSSGNTKIAGVGFSKL